MSGGSIRANGTGTHEGGVGTGTRAGEIRTGTRAEGIGADEGVSG